jgi:hypothetical protein
MRFSPAGQCAGGASRPVAPARGRWRRPRLRAPLHPARASTAAARGPARHIRRTRPARTAHARPRLHPAGAAQPARAAPIFNPPPPPHARVRISWPIPAPSGPLPGARAQPQETNPSPTTRPRPRAARPPRPGRPGAGARPLLNQPRRAAGIRRRPQPAPRTPTPQSPKPRRPRHGRGRPLHPHTAPAHGPTPALLHRRAGRPGPRARRDFWADGAPLFCFPRAGAAASRRLAPTAVCTAPLAPPPYARGSGDAPLRASDPPESDPKPHAMPGVRE